MSNNEWDFSELEKAQLKDKEDFGIGNKEPQNLQANNERAEQALAGIMQAANAINNFNSSINIKDPDFLSVKVKVIMHRSVDDWIMDMARNCKVKSDVIYQLLILVGLQFATGEDLGLDNILGEKNDGSPISDENIENIGNESEVPSNLDNQYTGSNSEQGSA